MTPINSEHDYLQRLRNAKNNMIEFADTQQISPNTYMGETIDMVLKILDREIDEIEYLRQF